MFLNKVLNSRGLETPYFYWYIYVNIFVHLIYRGYSIFLLNMAFISSSEVKNIYIS